MPRRRFAIAVLNRLSLVTAGVLLSIVQTLHGAPTRPNIVFILADDLGWSDTTLFGTTRYYQTPNLERLAKRGMLFTRAYAASPLCSPTRASILTGQTPARTGITAPVCHVPEVKLSASVQEKAPAHTKVLPCESATRLRTNFFTLAEALKKAGYATAHFGKWHLGAEPFSPSEQGFDQDLPHHPGPGPAGSYIAPWKFKNFKETTPGEHIEDRMAREAVAFMQRHKDGPFFLNYWMFSVHAPFDAKKSLIEKHRARVDPKDPQRCPTYAAMVESMDDAVGTLLNALDQLGIADRTAVIFFSDNGGNTYSQIKGVPPTSNSPLRGGKATLYEGGIRVPCIVNWPRLTSPGSRSDALIQSTDFYPTILALLDLKGQPGQVFDGVSIADALKGRALERSHIVSFFPHSPKVPDHLPPGVAVHSGDWKLIRLFNEGQAGAHAYQLYNLRHDLSETNNLAAQEPERVKQLDALIEQHLADTKAVVPRLNPAYDSTASDDTQASENAKVDSQGWKLRDCQAAVVNGVLIVKPGGSSPFLGIAAGKTTAPAKLTFRIRYPGGGAARIEWLPNPQSTDRAKSIPYRIQGADWQECSVTIPAEGSLRVLRLYLPPGKQPVEIDWIELKPANGKSRKWDF